MEFIYTLGEPVDWNTVFWKFTEPASVLAFYGSMGAGKTTLIEKLCAAKGVQDVMSSPTFSIINLYEYEENGALRQMVHMDWYRMKNAQELIQAGVEEYLYSNSICLIEWPQIAPELLPPHTCHIYITPLNEHQRKIEIKNESLVSPI